MPRLALLEFFYTKSRFAKWASEWRRLGYLEIEVRPVRKFRPAQLQLTELSSWRTR